MKKFLFILLLLNLKLFSQSDSTLLENDSTIFTITEEPAEYPGGIVEMMQFLRKKTIYPSCCDVGMCTTFLIKFVVDKQGFVKNISVITKGYCCPGWNEEIIRVIKLMPQWKPAKHVGKPVNSYFNIPMKIRLG